MECDMIYNNKSLWKQFYICYFAYVLLLLTVLLSDRLLSFHLSDDVRGKVYIW